MKPIRLEMNAFSSYLHKTVIDFEELNEKRLYLVSGDTGSGKTTIFDAICFALYGSASGSERNATSFRSDYANNDDETLVEFTFLLKGKYYTVKRTPTYTKQGYKTAKQATALLSFDETIIEGNKEVNSYIEKIMGVDVHQFKQIVMIAQGEFTKLIYASSEDREKILRKIFHSESLVSIETMLRNKTKELKDEYMVASSSLGQYMNMFDLALDDRTFHHSKIDMISHLLTEEEKELKAQEEIVNKENTLYETSYKNYVSYLSQNEALSKKEQIEKTYQELMIQEKEYTVLNQKIQKLKTVKEVKDSEGHFQAITLKSNQLTQEKETLTLSLADLEKKIAILEKEYASINEYHAQKEKLTLEVNESLKLLEYQNQYFDLKKKIEGLRSQIKVQEEQYLSHKTDLEKYHTRIERDQQKVSHLNELTLELTQYEKEEKEMSQQKTRLHQLSDLYDHYKNEQEVYRDLSASYVEISSIYQQEERDYQEKLELYRRSQAGILATTLKENEPCPVCGSLHHPSPTKLIDNALTSEQIDKIAKALKDKKVKVDGEYEKLLNQNTKLEQLKNNISLLKEQLEIKEELSKEVFISLLSIMTQKSLKHTSLYQKKNDEIDYLHLLSSSLQKDVIEEEKKSQVLLKEEQDLQSLKEQLIVHSTSCSDLKKQYPTIETINMSSISDQKELLKKVTIKIQTLEENHVNLHKEKAVKVSQLQTKDDLLKVSLKEKEDAHKIFNEHLNKYFKDESDYRESLMKLDSLAELEKTYQDYIILLETTKSKRKEIVEETKDYEYRNLDEYKLKLEALKTSKEEKSGFYQTRHVKFLNNKKVLQELSHAYTKFKKIDDDYTLYNHLNDLTIGKNSERLSFERYVLASYFEHILEFANIELMRLTSSSYRLMRRKDVKGSAKQGLDLDVFDYQTGLSRDIRTLSGGESFKAALALALGLSSMIQNYAGGIELNTLFIDEGFGSLDGESIDQAIDVLFDLSKDDKTIGIISHVDELKQRIDSQIKVEKKEDGSYLQVIA